MRAIWEVPEKYRHYPIENTGLIAVEGAKGNIIFNKHPGGQRATLKRQSEHP